MNCKPGDLAVIVRSYAGNEGKIVRCLRLRLNSITLSPNGLWTREPGWETDTYLRSFNGSIDRFVTDSLLRPIRDQPGEDETLTWAGKPADQTVTISSRGE